MTAIQIIKRVMKIRKVNATQLSSAMGYKSNASVSIKFTRDKDYKVKQFIKTLDAMGYECVVREKGKYRTKFRLTEDEE